MRKYNLEYRGAQLGVEVNNELNSSLYINGMRRDSRSPLAVPGRCTLSSTVQTDYEWHEFIEADVVLCESEIVITLSANNATLGSETFILNAA